MTAVAPANTTVSYIRQKIRRLTASSSEASLTTADLDQYLNNFYMNDFPYGVKVDQMKSVYTFFTRPYIDRYPLDVNFNQGVRAPLYIEGIQGLFTKDRTQFNNIWPRFPTKFQPIAGDGVTTSFTFTIQGPFLSKEVVIGGVSSSGSAISINDDGNGNLQLMQPNPVVVVPPQTQNVPGMHNANTGNPGLNNVTNIGTVNYVTGVMSFVLPAAFAAGTVPTVWVSQYQTGRPNTMLFWNNEFTIRPVPKLIHKVEIETYLTPVQFMESTDSPILNQWAKYLAYGSAIDILFDRQDLDGVENLKPMYDKQEALVLERQAVEEIGVANGTIYNSMQGQVGGNWGNNGWNGG